MSSNVPTSRAGGPSNESEFTVPDTLIKGQTMTKVSENKIKRVFFQLDPDAGCILYKSSKSGIVSLDSIKEIRSGAGARYYPEQFGMPKDTEQRWLTLIYILDGAYKTLHMLADTKDSFIMWNAAIRKLVTVRQGLMTGLGNVEERETIWTRQYWKGADGNDDGKLNLDEAERMCWRLNARFSKQELKAMFHDADPNNKGYLDYAGFQTFVRSLKRRPEIEQIYNDICKRHGGTFNFSVFETFMRETQHSTLTQDELNTIFSKYTSPKPSTAPTPATESKTSSTPAAESPPPASAPTDQNSPLLSVPATTPGVELTYDKFASFLLSFDNAVFSDVNRGIWQDMTRPVSEYYVSSSHNTYLVGHQLIGVSTIEGYIRALLHSCRSVELDIYDGDTEPVIFHGKTWTSKVSVRDVCHAIAKYAFVTSPYPILISAEIHCGIQQQDVLVNIMVEAFGDALIQAPVEGRPKLSALPSPEDLEGKVLLKAKNLYVVAQLEALHTKSPIATPAKQPAVLEADALSEDSDDDDDEGGIRGMAGDIKQGIHQLKEKWRRSRGTPPNNSTKTPKEKVKMSFSLASLLVYTVGVKCRGFGKETGYAPEHIFSLSESKANKLIKGGTMRDLVSHTKDHMVRIYPKGTRVNSTNYEPHRFWAAGAQIVAINWQTFDLGYTMNQAMFQRNGRAGWVLKPDALRGKDELLQKRSKHVLEVTIISAHQLPRLKDSTGHEVIEKSIVDPLVEVTLHIPDWTHPPFAFKTGSTPSPPPPADGTSSPRVVTARTRAVRNNGFNPVWKEKLVIPFDVVGGQEMQDLVFVQFSILEDDYDEEGDEPIAVYCSPLSCLEKGYRHLPLHDSQLSQYLFSTLFVQVQIRDLET